MQKQGSERLPRGRGIVSVGQDDAGEMSECPFMAL